jgi:hypothetical protein
MAFDGATAARINPEIAMRHGFTRCQAAKA